MHHSYNNNNNGISTEIRPLEGELQIISLAMNRNGTRRMKDDEKFEFERFEYQGGYSQSFLSHILKIFVTLTWILEPIEHKNR